MIQSVLQEAFPEVADRIPIRGEDGSWEYEGEGSMQGKQPHMASGQEFLIASQAASITRESTLLVDDDANNIRTALDEGVRAIWCNPDNPGVLEPEFLHPEL